MNDIILKSFDNIMYQQEKMDNKAYIFLGFIGYFLSLDFIGLKNIQLSDTFKIYLILLAMPLFFSLLPIANRMSIKFMMYCHFKFFTKEKRMDNNNIFYFTDIYYLSKNEFIKILEEFYDISHIKNSEGYLIEQILINAKILKMKVVLHSLTQLIFIILLILNIGKPFTL